MLSARRLRKDPSFAFFLLLPPSAHRITDSINADRNGPVVYLSLSSGMDCAWCFKCRVILPPGGAHNRPPVRTKVGEKFYQNGKKNLFSRQELLDPSCRPCARNMLAPNASFILTLICFCLILFCLFCSSSPCFVRLCLSLS